MTTLHYFGVVLGWPLDTFFGLSRFHGHGSWLVHEMALIYSFCCCSQSGNHEHRNVAIEHEITLIECDSYPNLYL